MALGAAVTVEVKGLTELNNRLKALSADMRSKTLRSAVAAGAAVVRGAVQRAAPTAAGPVRRGGGVVTQPGTLKRSVLTKYVSAESNPTQALYIVGFRQGKRNQKRSRDAFYAPWVEFGHAIVPRRGKAKGGIVRRRYIAKASGHTVAARPYFRPAYESVKQQALAAIQARLKARLDRMGA